MSGAAMKPSLRTDYRKTHGRQSAGASRESAAEECRAYADWALADQWKLELRRKQPESGWRRKERAEGKSWRRPRSGYLQDSTSE